MKNLRIWLSPLVIALFTHPAFAAWNETVNVIVDNPDELQGATIDWVLPDGAIVPGEVQEDEDGNQFLYFLLPGNTPSRGTISIRSADGDEKTFDAPPRGAKTTLILDLDAGTVSVSSALGAPGRRGFEFRVGLSASQLYTDYLSDVSSGSAGELADVFAGAGVTGASITEGADDNAFGLGVSLTGAWHFNDMSSLYMTGAYVESDEFEADVRGSGFFGTGDVSASNNIESELDIFSLTFGYEHNLGGGWGFYGGAGYTHTEGDIDFASVITIGGVPVSTASGSESENEDSWHIETGVSYRFGGSSKPWRAGFGASYTDEVLKGEPLYSVRGELSYGFDLGNWSPPREH